MDLNAHLIAENLREVLGRDPYSGHDHFIAQLGIVVITVNIFDGPLNIHMYLGIIGGGGKIKVEYFFEKSY